MKTIAITALMATITFAAAAQTPPTIHITVTKQESAAKQLAYAKELVAEAGSAFTNSPYERHLAVANAAANLEAVERGWPKERPLIIEANALLAKLYADAQMPQNAIEAGEHGLALAPDDHRLHLAMARAYERLGNADAAAREYLQTEATFDEHRVSDVQQISALNRIAGSYETQQKWADAARVLRRLVHLPASTAIDRVLFSERAVEDTLKAADRDSARRDLVVFRKALDDARSAPPTPEHQQLLKQAEEAYARYEAQLR